MSMYTFMNMCRYVHLSLCACKYFPDLSFLFKLFVSPNSQGISIFNYLKLFVLHRFFFYRFRDLRNRSWVDECCMAQE